LDNKKTELKQKIRDFNKLMGEISEGLKDIITIGEEKEFHDVMVEMLTSLNEAQKTVRQAYNAFLIKKEKRN